MTRVSPESTATPWAGPQAVSVTGSSDPVCAQGPLWETEPGGLWAGATGAGLGKERTSLKWRVEEGSGVAWMGWGCRALGGGGGRESEGRTRCQCGCVGGCTRVGVHRCARCSGSAHPKMLMTQASHRETVGASACCPRGRPHARAARVPRPASVREDRPCWVRQDEGSGRAAERILQLDQSCQLLGAPQSGGGGGAEW